jgi:hypothetical protein
VILKHERLLEVDLFLKMNFKRDNAWIFRQMSQFQISLVFVIMLNLGPLQGIFIKYYILFKQLKSIENKNVLLTFYLYEILALIDSRKALFCFTLKLFKCYM